MSQRNTTQSKNTRLPNEIKADDVVKIISDIGTVTLKSRESISHAEKAYANLSEAEKQQVSNYETLVEARKYYDNIALFDYTLLDDNTYSISAKNRFRYAKEEIVLPDKVGEIPVTAISEDGFEHCRFSSVIIPESVTYIGDNAFKDCKMLGSITMPEVRKIANSAFWGCRSLKDVTMPKVREIRNNAFWGCRSLENISMPNVRAIANGAFWGCWSLKNVTMPEVREIGNGAFWTCRSLKSVEMPVVNNVGNLFSGCTSLKSIVVSADNSKYCVIDGVLFSKDKTSLVCYPSDKKGSSYVIPNGVKYIMNGAFSDCRLLTSITIPDGVILIDRNVFCNCKALTSIAIPSSVVTIDEFVFCGCISLTSISVASENIEYSDIDGVLFNKDKTTLVCYPAGKKESNYAIPDGVTSVGRCAFSDSVYLTSIAMPSSVTSLDCTAFSGCKSLTSVKFSDGITEINSAVFSGCTSLSSVEIPYGVTYIDDFAFNGCESLTRITIANNVTYIGDFLFGDCKKLKDICYSGTKSQWEAIEKGFDWKSDDMHFTVHCTDGDITY